MKHRIYWTIVSVLLIGLILGSLLSLKGFEPREEFEVITPLKKAYYGIAIILYSLSFYRAGMEYPNIKKKLKDD